MRIVFLFSFQNDVEILHKNSEIVGCWMLDAGSFSQTALQSLGFRLPT